MRFVNHHNSQPDISSSVGINFFSDLSRDEIKKYYLGDNGKPEMEIPINETQYVPSNGDPAVPIDWR
jgi:hypothetical protein